MSRELWPFYEQELRFLRDQAKEFGKEYPREAGFLRLEQGGKSTDPHVERMMQAFALLSAKVRLKIDDDFPELTDALLTLLQPHYLSPLPSMLIAQFRPGTGADLVQGLPIPRHTPFQTSAVNDVKCEFRTVYNTKLWPVAVAEAQLKGPPYTDIRDMLPGMAIPANGAKSRIRLRFDLPTGGTFANLALGKVDPKTGEQNRLRLFIDADGPLTVSLYELLMNHVSAVYFRLPGTLEGVAVSPEEALQPVGFNISRTKNGQRQDEGVLPYPNQSFPGYRLLTEFFAYRDKYWFIDLGGWDRALAHGILAKNSVEVHIFLDTTTRPDWEQAVSKATFKLGCVPMVNLFERKSTEGIRVTQKTFEYPVVTDSEHPDGYEIYSVDQVYHRTQTGEEIRFEPFYSFRHQDSDAGKRFWFAKRRPAGKFMDRGTEVDIHFTDANFNPAAPAQDIALASVTCLNRDLPNRLRENLDAWRLESKGMVVPADIMVIRAPTATLRPMQKKIDTVGQDASLRKMQYWRVISHLSLNHLSLADSEEGRAALTEYLSLYDFADDQQSELYDVSRQIREGVLRISCQRDVAFVSNDGAGGYARGMEVVLELDEEKYVGTGAYLFASVMERFFALAVSMNSFTRTTYRTRQRGLIKSWPARAGEKPII
jgi:type VI secretion system protein ImpG